MSTFFLTVAQTEKCFGWFSRSYRHFSIHVFIIKLMYPQDEMSRDELSLNSCPKTGFGSFWSSKFENSSHFSVFSMDRSSSGQSSTLGSPHPFIHLSIQVVGNDFCWPNFIRSIFLKSTAPRWGETFDSKWEKTKEPTETGEPLPAPLWWPMAIVSSRFTTGVKTMAYLRYLEIHSWSSCFVSGQVNDLVMTFLPHQSHQSLFVTYKAWYQLKPWPWTN